MRNFRPKVLALLIVATSCWSFTTKLKTERRRRRISPFRDDQQHHRPSSSLFLPIQSTRTSPLLNVHTSNTDITQDSIFSFVNETTSWDSTTNLLEQKSQYDELMQRTSLLSTSTPTITPTTTKTTMDPQTCRLLLIAAAALYGTNFVCVKLLGGTDLPIGLSSTLRFGLAALSTLPWLYQKQQQNDNDHHQKAFLAGFEVGLWTSIGYIAQAVGLETTLASESAFLCSLAVVVVPLLDRMTGKRLQPRQVVGALLALLGVGLLELGDGATTVLTWGDGISMLQPLAFGVGFWRMEAAMRKFPQHANVCTAAQLLAVFVASGAYTLVAERQTLTGGGAGDIAHNILLLTTTTLADPFIWMGLLWTGIVTTALSVYMETVALQTLSAAETTLILSTEPLWGSITAALVLGESFGPTAMGGGALVILACVWSNLGAEGLRNFFFCADEGE